MKKFVFICLFALCYSNSSAIAPPLEREINLSFSNEQFSAVLNKIQEQTGLIFSYKPSIVNAVGPVSLQLKHKTVREALALMLPKNIIYKAKNNYIILKEKPEEKNPKKTEISGYVYDKTTEQKVANVTIYDKESLQSVTTNQYGYYSISVPSANEKININKENYQDTSFSLASVKDNKINNITLNPATDLQRKQDSSERKNNLKELGLFSGKFYKKFKGFVNTINVKDSLTRKVQFSLVPFVGTNHKLSGSVVNNLSFNLGGGFAKGLNGFEVAGGFNIDRENVRGTQLAGVFNIVGDTVRGSQIAGYFNITGGYMNGFQGAGTLNLNLGNQKGVQAAYVLNINKRRAEGLSMAGLMNVSNSVRGAQVAGIGNVNDTLRGIAIAGVFNSTDVGKKSAQIACLFNKQKSGSSYLQIAALFNTTSYLKGLQLGMFNFADSASGVPLGLFSFVKKGVHQIELNSDELFPANISFRTGVPAFYNIFSVGFQPASNKNLWQLGYGAGTSFEIYNKLRGDITFSMHHVNSGNFYFATSELYRFYLGVEYKVAKKFSLAVGPTFNIYWTDALLPDYQSKYNSIAPYHLFNTSTGDNFNLKGWVGGRIALRFL